MSPSLLASLERIHQMPGWCSTAKAVALAKVVLETRPALCVEVGVFGGRSLAALAMAIREVGKGVVYGIDPYEPCYDLEGENDPRHQAWWASCDYPDILRHAMAWMTHFDLWRYARLLNAPAHMVEDVFAAGSVGLLHLDANHAAETTLRDVSLYLPKVMPGGFVVLDDADWSCNGRHTAEQSLAMLEGRCDLVRILGNCRLYR